MNTPPSAPKAIHTLICRRDLEMGFICLDSLVSCSAEAIHFVFHEDGSLREEDIAQLTSHYPGCAIVTKAQSEEFVFERIKNYPNCVAYRKNHAFGLKLLDIPLLSGDTTSYCDCDILFYRKFDALFGPRKEDDQALFLTQDGRRELRHSLRRWRSYRNHGICLPPHLNAGLFEAPKSIWDLDFIEWFLSLKDLHVPPELIEQNCWASMVMRKRGLHYFDLSQIYCAGGRPDPVPLKPDSVGFHFISPHKIHFNSFREKVHGMAESSERCSIRKVPAGKFGLAYILRWDGEVEARRWARKLLRRTPPSPGQTAPASRTI